VCESPERIPSPYPFGKALWALGQATPFLTKTLRRTGVYRGFTGSGLGFREGEGRADDQRSNTAYNPPYRPAAVSVICTKSFTSPSLTPRDDRPN